MPVKVFLNQKYSHQHENTIFDQLIAELDAKWSNSDEQVIVMGNFNCNASELDAMVLKKDSITVIDFKNYGGKIIFSENGKWKADGVPVKGGGQQNPFVQIKNNKFAVLNYLKSNGRNIFTNGNQPNLGHISGMVLFHQEVTRIEGHVPPNIKTWFHITDLKNASQKLYQIASSEILLTDDELLKIPESLGLKAYKHRKEAPDTIPVQSTEKKEERPKFTLTDSQQKALREIDEFLSDSTAPIFILNGAVSSGKTYIIPEIVSKISNKQKESFLLAPNTRQSARLSKETQLHFDSIYNHMYMFSNTTISEDEETEESSKKANIGFRQKRSNEDVIYIIDEAHIISDSYYESENFVFGTGKLLTDFIEYCDLKSGNKKVIVIGDDKQIIVGAKDQTIMSAEHLTEQHELNSHHYEMEEVIHGGGSSDIISNAVNIRNVIASKTWNKLAVQPSESIQIVESDTVLSTYAKDLQHNPYETKVLRYSYDRINDFNNKVKSEILKNLGLIAQNDLVHFHNTYRVPSDPYQIDATPIYIPNGESAIINAVYGEEKITQPLKGRKDPVVLTFITVDLTIKGRSNPFKGVKVLKNFLLEPRSELSQENFLALRVNFETRFRKDQNELIKTLKETKDRFKKGDASLESRVKHLQSEYYQAYSDAMRSDLFLNAAMIKIGYSISGHKAEGFNWDTVYVDMEIGKGKFNEDYFRWIYTTLSRAKKKLVVFNYEQLHPLMNLEFRRDLLVMDANYKFSNNLEYDPPEQLTEEELEQFKVFEIGTDKPYLGGICRLLQEQLPIGVKIKSIGHHDWQEVYTFVENDIEAIARVHYKGPKKKYQISKVELISGAENSLGAVLQDLYNPKKVEPTYNRESIDLEQSFLVDFVKLFDTELQEQDVKIHHIKTQPWLLKIYVEKGDSKAEVFVDYNAEGFIKWIRAQRATNDDIVQSIHFASESLIDKVINEKI